MAIVNLESRLKFFQNARCSILAFNENKSRKRKKKKVTFSSFKYTFFGKLVWCNLHSSMSQGICDLIPVSIL